MSIALALRLFLAALFARTAWHKWHDAVQFRSELRAYRLLPHTLVPLTAMLLALAESLCVILLLWLSSTSGIVLALILLTLYTFVMAINLVRGHHDIDCGCSTSLSAPKKLSRWLLVRNFLLILTTISSMSKITIVLFNTNDWILTVIITLTLLLVLEAFEQALANSQRYHHWQKVRS